MPSSLQRLPNEVLLLVVSYIPENARPILASLSLSSRFLHAAVTPKLYASIAVGEEAPFLVRSLMRNPRLRSYPQSLTLSMPEPESRRDAVCEAYSTDDADVTLLQTTIEEMLQDDVWHQPPPQDWCDRLLTMQALGEPWWSTAADYYEKHWEAQFALLLVLMPGLTHLTMTSDQPGLFFTDCIQAPDCMSLTMMAAANTQLRAIADPNAAGGVLPRLRSVSLLSCPDELGFPDPLPPVLPPLVEELQVGNYKWGRRHPWDHRSWEHSQASAGCEALMKLNVKTMVVQKNGLSLENLLNLLRCVPKLEKLAGCPGISDDTPFTMLEALESVAGTIKELDFSEDVWPYRPNPMLFTPCGPLCDFPALEKLSISAERQIHYFKLEQAPVELERMLLGHFPTSLKELHITANSHASVMSLVPALSCLVVSQELPALRLITVGLGEKERDDEKVVTLRRLCEARGVDLALPLVNRTKTIRQCYPDWVLQD